MIKVFIPNSYEFLVYERELRKMYEEAQDRICDTNSFDFIVTNTLFYFFTEENVLLGAIYYFMEDDKLFLNAYAGRKHFESNIKALKMSLDWFNCNIYAEAQNKASAICLIKAGFKRMKGNLFCFFKDI